MALTAVTIIAISVEIPVQRCGFFQAYTPNPANPPCLVSTQYHLTHTSASYPFPPSHNSFFIPLFALSNLAQLSNLSLLLLHPISQTLGGGQPSRTPSNSSHVTHHLFLCHSCFSQKHHDPILHGWCLLHTLPPPHSSLHHQATYSPQANHLTPKKPRAFRQPIGRKPSSPPPFQRIMVTVPYHRRCRLTPTLSFPTKKDGTDRHARAAAAARQNDRHTSPLPTSLQPFFSRRRTDCQDGAEKQRTRMKARPLRKSETKQGHAPSRGRAEAAVAKSRCDERRAYVRHEPV
ncbi:hypothetical protein J3F84DRAFT_110478 [Trichoderma pleuroticola]